MGTIGLLKFGEIEHIKRFMLQGELYFNTVEYFSANQHDGTSHFRFDRFEGSSHIYQPDQVAKITIAGMEVKMHPDAGPIIMRVSRSEYYTHVFCLTNVSEPVVVEGTKRVFDPRMFKFGTAAAMILDTIAFMDLLAQYIKKSTDIAELKAGYVEYFDAKEYSGETGAFRKADTYSYQRECRIALNTATEGPYTMRLGSLKGIAYGPILQKDCINLIKDEMAILS